MKKKVSIGIVASLFAATAGAFAYFKHRDAEEAAARECVDEAKDSTTKDNSDREDLPRSESDIDNLEKRSIEKMGKTGTDSEEEPGGMSSEDSGMVTEDKSAEIPAEETSEVHEDVEELWRDRHNRDRNRGRGRVCYYGCPNSKRVEKLNLRKEL